MERTSSEPEQTKDSVEEVEGAEVPNEKEKGRPPARCLAEVAAAAERSTT